MNAIGGHVKTDSNRSPRNPDYAPSGCLNVGDTRRRARRLFRGRTRMRVSGEPLNAPEIGIEGDRAGTEPVLSD